jgi:hypothetical protein
VLCCALLIQACLLELLGRLLELPANLDFLLSCGQLLPAFVRSTRVALDHCNSLEADEPSMMTGGEATSRLSMLLQVRRVYTRSMTKDNPACCRMCVIWLHVNACVLRCRQNAVLVAASGGCPAV